MHPAYYENFKEIKKKIWSMLNNGVTDRRAKFGLDNNKEYWLVP